MQSGKIWLVAGILILAWGGVCWLGAFTNLSPAEELRATTIADTSSSSTGQQSPANTSPLPPARRKILGASLLIGRALYVFEDLGNNGKSCKSCHQQGADSKGQPWKRKEGDTYVNGKMSLAKAINFCVTGHQGGTALQASGTEMKSLVLYVSSLQR